MCSATQPLAYGNVIVAHSTETRQLFQGLSLSLLPQRLLWILAAWIDTLNACAQDEVLEEQRMAEVKPGVAS